MATIRISLRTPGQILIEPVGEIDTEEWVSLRNWWSSDSANNESTGQISVLPSEFAYKKNWLRENWTRLGHKVELDKEVVAAVQTVEGLISDFDKLAINQDRTTAIDTTNLLLTVNEN